MGDYTYKRVDESCYEDLVYLFKAAFNTKTTTEYYRGKMNTGYLGVTHLGYLAYDHNHKPAAFYGVFPYKMEYKNKLYLAAQSGDTMTHPQHKGKGLFTALGKMTYELAKKEGIQFIFGLPNQFSYHGLVKSLKWTHVDDMVNYQVKVFTLPLSALCKRFAFLMPLYNRYAKMILGSSETKGSVFISSAISEEFGGVYRDEAFYNYKKFYNNHLIEIANLKAWIKIDGSLVIGDIEYRDRADTKAVIQKIRKLAFLLGCTDVMFPVSPKTHWDLRLKPVLQQQKGLALCLIDLQSGLPLDKFRFTAADFDTF